MRVWFPVVLLVLLWATNLYGQAEPVKRSLKLPSSKALPGSFVAHRVDADGKAATRPLWRESEETLEAGEQVEFENAWFGQRLKDEHLDALLAVPYIQRLHLDFSALSDDGVARVAGMSGITHLDIRNKFSDQRAASFANWTGLVHLQLTSCAVTDDGMRHFSGNMGLRHLGLQGLDNVTDKTLQQFAECKDIAKLDLTMSPLIRGEGIGNWPLKEFIAQDCRALTGLGMARAVQSSTLEHVNVSGCRAVDDAGVLALKDKSALAVVDLSQCGMLSDSGAQSLATCPGLWFVNLENCRKLGDATLKALAKLPKLQRLFCKGMLLVSPAGVAAFRDNQTLQVLQIESDKLDDDTAAVVATISELETLGMENSSKLTDSGILKLAALAKLTMLDVDNCGKITAAGIQALKQKLPHLKVSLNMDFSD